MSIFPSDATSLTHLFVVSDLSRSVAWYRDVLGAEVVDEYGGTSAVLRFVGSWLLLVTGGPPTDDKPGVAMAAPTNDAVVSDELIVAVPDCRAAVAELRARGASFRNEIITGVGGRQVLVEDPSGNPVELFQPILDEARM